MEKARIAYNGPSLEYGQIDVRKLAPALLDFTDLIENANLAIGGEYQI